MIGNCQALGVAQTLRLLGRPGELTYITMASLRKRYGTVEGLARHLRGFDLVYSQYFPPGFLADGDLVVLRERMPGITVFPTIVFPAFHPDMIYVGDISQLARVRLVPSPMGQYHSALALYGFRAGFSQARTVALFDEAVYRRVGYLDLWAAAERELLQSGRDWGFPLDREFLRWSRRGSFMHVFNHPKLFVLADLGRRLLEGSGVPQAEMEVEDYLGDDLVLDVIWPIYRPIAELYGLPGSSVFKMKNRQGDLGTMYDLPEFVAASHAVYAAQPPGHLTNGRVEAWLQDPETSAFLRESAGA